MLVDDLAPRVADLRHHRRLHHVAAVDQGGVGDGHLEGGGGEGPLTDGQVHQVAAQERASRKLEAAGVEAGGRVGVLELVLLPLLEQLGRGDHPGRLSGEIDAGDVAVAQLAGELLEGVDVHRVAVLPHTQRHRPEVDVARLFQGTVEVQPPLVAGVPVVLLLDRAVGQRG